MLLPPEPERRPHQDLETQDADITASVISQRAESVLRAARGARIIVDTVAEGRLRNAVCAYVDALRAIQLPPDRTVLAVKDLLHRGGLASDDQADGSSAGALFDRALTWGAERVFDVERSE